jgi:cytoskeletal protein CcmA (bactofilin family)
MRYYRQYNDRNTRQGDTDGKPHGPLRPTAPSTIVSSLLITGNIESAHDLEIDGKIIGDVTCAALTVGKDATVTGSIRARQVVVRGRVAGSIHAEFIILQHSARVDADLHQELLTIEEGAEFNGRSRPRSQAGTAAATPLALAPPAEAA